MPTARSQSISLLLHVVVLALLLLLTSQSFRTPEPIRPIQAIPLALPPLVIHVVETRGGGSNTSPAPARRGVPPPRAHRTFIPPVLHSDPKMPVMPAIDFDVPVLDVDTAKIGDPFSKLAGVGLGNLRGPGIGSHPGGPGVGDGPRPNGSGRLGMPIKPAELIHQVDPEFSEEARKAKFQGVVVMMIEVGTDGRAHNPQIVEDPGLGLSQKAIEAVEQWRFRPAQRGGAAVVSTARVEVHFHLL